MTLADWPKWLEYSLISSMLCIAGAFCVPLLQFLCNTSNTKSVSSKFLNYGLSLSAGSMLTTSLHKMLPGGKSDRAAVFAGFLIGVALSLLLNFIVHAYTSESLIHCAHGNSEMQGQEQELEQEQEQEPEQEQEQEQEPEQQLGYENNRSHLHGHTHGHTHDHTYDHTHGHTHGHTHDHTHREEFQEHERQPLLQKHALKSKPSLLNLFAKESPTACMLRSGSVASTTTPASCQGEAKSGVACLENNIGYDLENLDMYRAHFLSGTPRAADHHHAHGSSVASLATSHPSTLPNHQHHLATPFSKLVSIGVQTCIVITLHKFPEGLVIFYTNHDSRDSESMGFSIFLSLAMHNFIEGFAMTLPLYTALSNKWLALLLTSILGGASQPLGALLGYFIFRSRDPAEDKPHMVLLLSVTAGFLFVIGLQMFQTAVGFSDVHHHHRGENDDQISEQHSLGTTCLKWCCLGALLILASAAFA